MNLRELVGKKVVRTKPVDYGRGVMDYSYCDMDTCITVVDIVDDIPILKMEKDCLGERVRTLDIRFDDDGWKDVTKVWERIDEMNEHIKTSKNI